MSPIRTLSSSILMAPLSDTNAVDGDTYWQPVCGMPGLSGEQPDWSAFRHVTDAGIAAKLCLHYPAAN